MLLNRLNQNKFCWVSHSILLVAQIIVLFFVFDNINTYDKEEETALHIMLDARKTFFGVEKTSDLESLVLLNNVDLRSHAAIVFGKIIDVKTLNGVNIRSQINPCLSGKLNECPWYYKGGMTFVLLLICLNHISG